MRPGHENCPEEHGYDIVEEKTMADPAPVTYIICGHHHSEPVTADDTLGTGPVVADYCHCCGAMIRKEDYR